MTSLSKAATGTALVGLLALAGCGQSQEYFANDGDGWRAISRAEYEAGMADTAAADPAETRVRAAMTRNPIGAAPIAPASHGTLPADAVADLSVEITRDICNIPPDVAITPDTPCPF